MDRPLRTHNFVCRIALQVEQSGKIAVFDRRVCRVCDHRFGAIGDPKSGSFEHGKVVCPVTDRERRTWRQSARPAEFIERCTFRRSTENRFDDPAGQASINHLENVRPVLMKTCPFSDNACKARKAAGDQRAIGPICSHRRDQFFGAPGEADSFVDDVADNTSLEPGEPAHALAKGGLKVQFATHRAFCHGPDGTSNTGHVGQFIDAFLLDDRRIHIRDQQRLAPVIAAYDGIDVNRHAGHRRAQALHDFVHIH